MSNSSGKKIVIPSDLKEAHALQQKLLSEVQQAGYCEDSCFAIRLALDEALCNAVKHGNQLDPSRKVQVDYEIDEESVKIIVTDEGDGFNPGQLDDPTQGNNLERPSGRGVMLIKAYMSEVRYNDRGNRVEMVKYRDCKLPEGKDLSSQ